MFYLAGLDGRRPHFGHCRAAVVVVVVVGRDA
jgi:hypothetical protein